MKKRLLSLVLTLAMAMSLCVGMAVTVSAAETHADHCVCGAAGCGEHGSETGWQAWEFTTSLPTTTGKYYLTNNVTLSGSNNITGDVVLCLNGFVVTKVNTLGFIHVESAGKFTLTDCQETPHKFRVGNDGCWVLDEENGSKTVNGGVITGTVSYTGLRVMGGTFTMYGGNIVGNPGNINGGGIMATSSSTVTIYGGKICGNSTPYSGGGIAVMDNSILNLYGGEISGNTAAYGGGGINCNNSTFKVHGAPVVSDNKLGSDVNNVQTNSAITIDGPLTGNAKIGVTAAADAIIANGWSNMPENADPNQYFFSDAEGYSFSADDGALKCVEGAPVVPPAGDEPSVEPGEGNKPYGDMLPIVSSPAHGVLKVYSEYTDGDSWEDGEDILFRVYRVVGENREYITTWTNVYSSSGMIGEMDYNTPAHTLYLEPLAGGTYGVEVCYRSALGWDEEEGDWNEVADPDSSYIAEAVWDEDDDDPWVVAGITNVMASNTIELEDAVLNQYIKGYTQQHDTIWEKAQGIFLASDATLSGAEMYKATAGYGEDEAPNTEAFEVAYVSYGEDLDDEDYFGGYKWYKVANTDKALTIQGTGVQAPSMLEFMEAAEQGDDDVDMFAVAAELGIPGASVMTCNFTCDPTVILDNVVTTGMMYLIGSSNDDCMDVTVEGENFLYLLAGLYGSTEISGVDENASLTAALVMTMGELLVEDLDRFECLTAGSESFAPSLEDMLALGGLALGDMEDIYEGRTESEVLAMMEKMMLGDVTVQNVKTANIGVIEMPELEYTQMDEDETETGPEYVQAGYLMTLGKVSLVNVESANLGAVMVGDDSVIELFGDRVGIVNFADCGKVTVYDGIMAVGDVTATDCDALISGDIMGMGDVTVTDCGDFTCGGIQTTGDVTIENIKTVDIIDMIAAGPMPSNVDEGQSGEETMEYGAVTITNCDAFTCGGFMVVGDITITDCDALISGDIVAMGDITFTNVQGTVESEYSDSPAVNAYEGTITVNVSNLKVLSGEDADSAVQLTLRSNAVNPEEVGEYFYIGAAMDAPKVKSFTVTHETEQGKSDGSIAGVTSGMEWRTPGGEWTACDGTKIENLACGTYQIRNKASGGKRASGLVEVEIQTTYSVTVPVKLQQGEVPVTNAEVKLISADGTEKELPHVDDGKYSAKGVANGDYNVVVKVGEKVKTALITVNGNDVELATIRISQMKINSTVDVTVDAGNNSPVKGALVGGLDNLADNIAGQAEAEKPTGATVDIDVKMKIDTTVSDAVNEEKKDAIEAAAQEQSETLTFLEIKIDKTITVKQDGEEDDVTTESVDDTVNLLQIVIPFDTEDKEDFAVYRYHTTSGNFGEAVQKLVESDDVSAERIVVGDGVITLHVRYFSTYAIGYTDTSEDDGNNGGSGGIGGYIPAVKPSTEPVSYDKCKHDGACSLNNFVDLSATAWYHDGVHYCIDHGIMNGYGSSFRANGAVTRQQVWMMLARISGETPADMAAARAWAMENGVSDGTNPTKAVTRQQFITMLYRYAVDQGYDVSVGEDTNILSYEDAFDISEYAIPAVQWGCGSGIMGGYADGTVKPFETATRAHVAAFLQRFCVGA